MRVANPPPRPLVVFDGDCGFCRFWVERLRQAGGEPMDWAPSQEVASDFPEIPPEAFARAVQLIEPDGTVLEGADVFVRIVREIPGWSWTARIAEALPGARPVLRWGYGLVARHRPVFSWLNHLAWGCDPSPSSFLLARRLFALGLGAIFLSAFLSLAVQIKALAGSQGIQPAGDFLVAAQHQLHARAYWEVPSLFWLNSSDGMLVGSCLAGAVISLVLAAGCWPGLCCLLLWFLYLSLCSIGSPFLDFQWDALLLETALPAALFLPWRARPRWGETSRMTTLGRWLLWWLLFRLMLESAVVKLTSGDPAWRHLTALSFHYETQPLPLPLAWLAHQAPPWVHRLEALAMFAIEFLGPLAILSPRRLRHLGAGAMIALQVAIGLTGNYAFFNLLTILLCLLLWEDRAWPARLRAWLVRAPFRHRSERRWFDWPVDALAAFGFFFTGILLAGKLDPKMRWPAPIATLDQAVAPLRSFNAYGLFAVMTTSRPEIVLEGSNDGVNWNAYEFPYKVGNPRRIPAWAQPHQPRVDWQCWFAALGTPRENPWLLRLMSRLLEGSPPVLGLLEWNPFPGEPPKYLRAVLYQYHFTHWGEGQAWWKRDREGVYYGPVQLKGD